MNGRRGSESSEPRHYPGTKSGSANLLTPLLVLAGVFLLQWMLLMNLRGPTWDAAFYYAFGHSLAFDFDLQLENDLRLSYPTATPDFVEKGLHNKRTDTGRVDAPFAIGTGLLWMPIMLAFRIVSWLPGVQDVNGHEWYVVTSVLTASALAGLVAFVVAFRIAWRETGERTTALMATATLMFATPLIYYQFREPLYAHIPSALMTTLFIYVWSRSHRRIPAGSGGMVLGALLGLASLMRWQNAIYAVLPLVSASWAWLCLPSGRRRRAVPNLVAYLSSVAGAALAVFSIQMVVWRIFYGSLITVPQGTSFMQWTAPFFPQVLFSPFRGLIPWMPVFALALVGLFLRARRKPRLVVPLLVLLALGTYVNASTPDWFAGGGYGPRRSSGELAVYVLGYAWLLREIPGSLRAATGALLGVLLASHQWLLLRYGLVERLGGRVVSMAPRFEWSEVDIVTFARQMWTLLPRINEQPLDFLIFPGSPLFVAFQARQFPLKHLLSLGLAAVLLTAVLALSMKITVGRETKR